MLDGPGFNIEGHGGFLREFRKHLRQFGAVVADGEGAVELAFDLVLFAEDRDGFAPGVPGGGGLFGHGFQGVEQGAVAGDVYFGGHQR